MRTYGIDPLRAAYDEMLKELAELQEDRNRWRRLAVGSVVVNWTILLVMVYFTIFA